MNDGTLREIKTLPVLLRGCGVYTRLCGPVLVLLYPPPLLRRVSHLVESSVVNLLEILNNS